MFWIGPVWCGAVAQFADVTVSLFCLIGIVASGSVDEANLISSCCGSKLNRVKVALAHKKI
jgi:hypothetical protein